MASGVFDDILIQHLWSTEEFRNIFNDQNRLQKWYDYEAAFALEQGELGIIPKEAAADIAANCKISKIDVNAVAAEIRRQAPAKSPVVIGFRILFTVLAAAMFFVGAFYIVMKIRDPSAPVPAPSIT